MVHPDKRLDMPQARDAFEEVKKAYQVGIVLVSYPSRFPIVQRSGHGLALYRQSADVACGASCNRPVSAVIYCMLVHCTLSFLLCLPLLSIIQILLDENRRNTMAATIEAVVFRVKKERQRKLDKQMSLADVTKEFGSEEAHKKKACMKEVCTRFAAILRHSIDPCVLHMRILP